MTTVQRRAAILTRLQEAQGPIAARELAAAYGVSRQVIVQDIAVIRAYTPELISTTRGYVLQSDPETRQFTREFKVRHRPEETEQELNLIVDCGGHVKTTSISHRVYGRITVDMDIHSRQDVAEFISSFQGSQSSLLSGVTSGYHYHLVEARQPQHLELIEEKLREAGFLAPLQPWEQS